MIRTSGRIPAVFVAARNALGSGSGGVQLYTRELIDVLRAAGFDLNVVDYETDRSALTRLRRRVRPRPYSDQLPSDLTNRVYELQQRSGSEFIFLTSVALAPLAQMLRAGENDSKLKIVLFSYGLESVDYLHVARARSFANARRVAKILGRQLIAECRQRNVIDYVFTLAPFEAEIERWLGAKNVSWLPRTIPTGEELDWKPDPCRLGCVSTLDHPPNYEGLHRFLEEFQKVAPAELQFRVVGGPRAFGQALVARFGHAAKYLGPLDDQHLREEASTWSGFVHPLFCYSRGCSTKLAVALSWRIPIVTTLAGARGYRWRHGHIPLAETPSDLAALAISLSKLSNAQAIREQIRAVAESSPTIEEVGRELRSALLGDPTPKA
jgi:glycosyl transferase family 1